PHSHAPTLFPYTTLFRSIQNLISCSRDTGNYLLNIGPRADGSVPEESVRVLTEVGQWMRRNGDSIYASDPCQPRRSNYAGFTRKDRKSTRLNSSHLGISY